MIIKLIKKDLRIKLKYRYLKLGMVVDYLKLPKIA